MSGQLDWRGYFARTKRLLILAVLGWLAVTGRAKAQETIVFENSCEYALNFVSTGSGLAAAIGTLAPRASKSISLATLKVGSPNPVMAYPQMTADQCPNCDNWTALGGAPGTKQREGYMWLGTKAVFAKSCNPNLSGRGICATQKNCCGPDMAGDGTFGTLFEFTPGAAGQNDTLDISTNFGSGPKSPPVLCGSPHAKADDCVSAAANIFFNLPVRWTSNFECSFTTFGLKRKSGECREASCSEAFQHPTDDKLVSCPVQANRSYTVTWCPAAPK